MVFLKIQVFGIWYLVRLGI